MTTAVKLPLMGEGVIEATVGRWLKEIGDFVAVDEPLVEVETDKVTTEIVADTSGTLLQILVAEGETAAVDQPLALIGEAGDTVANIAQTVPVDMTVEPEPSLRAVAAQSTPVATSVMAQPLTVPQLFEAKPVSTYNGRISPVVSRMVKEHQLDLDLISGTGKNGRITKRDVLAYIDSDNESRPKIAPLKPVAANGHHAMPQVPVSKSPVVAGLAGTLQPHTKMRQRIADHMVLSKATSPHATTVFEIDLTKVVAHRKAHKASFAERGAKLTYMAYIASAVIEGLRQVPQVNSQWRDDGIFWHQSVHLGIATAVPNGLVVPVVRQAEVMNLFGLAQQIAKFAEKSRNNQLQASDLQGGTFTITNHGVFGSIFATPIINQPQCGILGVGAVEDRVCAVNGMIGIRPKAYFSFSFDHRILDGADADRFMQIVKQQLENWENG